MKYFYFLACVLLFASCEREAESFIEVSIGNHKGDTIYVRGIDFEKVLVKNESGIFKDTLSIPYKGLFELEFNDDELKSKTIYLEPDKALSVQVKNLDSLQNIFFEGVLSKENNYLLEKGKIYTENYFPNGLKFLDLFKGDESEFLAKIDSYQKKLSNLIENYAIINTFFVEQEMKSIQFESLHFKLIYEGYHRHVTNNNNYQAPKSFTEIPANLNLDDDQAFIFSSAYKNLISHLFVERINKNGEYDKAYEIGVSYLKSLKSQNIKESLLGYMFIELNSNAENLDERYTTLLDITTSKKFEEALNEKYTIIKNLVEGKPSPIFEKYVNHDGTTSSLADFKGKYVYIDVWATWCGPCVAEIPALQTLEKQFHDANIAFVSISIDNEKDFEKWQNYVADKNLGGVQLFADKDWSSEFVQNYAIDGIPRFILLNPAGEIVNADAPRPSDEKLVQDLKALGL